jgi:hypothetical protein
VLAKSPESRAILYGALDDRDHTYLVRLPATNAPEPVLRQLEPYRPLLATRAEIARNARRRWWESTWPRGDSDLKAPKVIALYRTDRGRFALDEYGEWQPSIKSTLVVGRDEGAPVAYLCGLLNSELLDLWYAVRGKTPWHVRRNYEPKRMNEMPYRRPEGDPRADRVAELVRAIAANRRALLPHRPFVRELSRIVKDPWRDGPVEVDRAALVAALERAETVSVRLDPELMLETVTTPPGRARREAPDLLVFKRGRAVTTRVSGSAERLDLLEALAARQDADDVGAILLPKSLDRLDGLADERRDEVRRLFAEGRRLVEEVERLVCALYDLPDDLTDEVVAHADSRARSRMPPEEASESG